MFHNSFLRIERLRRVSKTKSGLTAGFVESTMLINKPTSAHLNWARKNICTFEIQEIHICTFEIQNIHICTFQIQEMKKKQELLCWLLVALIGAHINALVRCYSSEKVFELLRVLLNPCYTYTTTGQ